MRNIQDHDTRKDNRKRLVNYFLFLITSFARPVHFEIIRGSIFRRKMEILVAFTAQSIGDAKSFKNVNVPTLNLCEESMKTYRTVND